MNKQVITADETIARIPLSRGMFAIVDRVDLHLVRGRKWHACERNRVWYASSYASKPPLMHRLILDAPENVKVDHRDGDGLNNTRANLRLATHAENMRNSRLKVSNTSGFRGVYFHKQRGKWRATIRAGARRLSLGMFDTAEEAAIAYDRAAVIEHGEFASLNFDTRGHGMD